jgi:hypothetical protein
MQALQQYRHYKYQDKLLRIYYKFTLTIVMSSCKFRRLLIFYRAYLVKPVFLVITFKALDISSDDRLPPFFISENT